MLNGALSDRVKSILNEWHLTHWKPHDSLGMYWFRVIKIEGEGTSASPFEQPGDPAHYYKFGEIVAGREIVQTPTGFAYDGAPILFEFSGVWPIKANCKIADFAIGTQARTRIEQFAFSYGTLPKYSPCASADCLYAREPGEPSDPIYPEYWTAKWSMYGVDRVRHRMHRHSPSRQHGHVTSRTELSMGAERRHAGCQETNPQ